MSRSVNTVAEIHTGATASGLFRRLAGGGLFALSGKVASALLALVVNGLITRLARPEDVGVYFLLASVIGFAVMLAQMGSQHVVVRLASEEIGKGRLSHARGAVIGAVQATALGCAAVALLIVTWGETMAAAFNISLPLVMVMTMTAWLVARAFESIFAESFRAFHDIARAALFSGVLVNALMALILVLLFATARAADILTLLIVTVLAAAGSAAAAGMMLRMRLKSMPEPTPHPVAGIVRTAWPLLVSSLGIVLLNQADIWLVGALLTERDVALYGAAVRLVQMVMMPMLVLNAVLPPMVAELHGAGRLQTLETVLRTTAALTACAAGSVLLVFVVAGNLVLEAVFGGFYGAALLPLVMLGAGQLVNAACGSGAIVLMMTGRQVPVMVISMVCCALLMAAGSYVAPRYGIAGLAMVSGACTALHGLLSLFWVRKALGVRTLAGLPDVRTLLAQVNAGRRNR